MCVYVYVCTHKPKHTRARTHTHTHTHYVHTHALIPSSAYTDFFLFFVISFFLGSALEAAHPAYADALRARIAALEKKSKSGDEFGTLLEDTKRLLAALEA